MLLYFPAFFSAMLPLFLAIAPFRCFPRPGQPYFMTSNSETNVKTAEKVQKLFSELTVQQFCSNRDAIGNL